MASQSQKKKHGLNVFDFILIILVIIVLTVSVVKLIRSNPNIISGGNVTAVCTVTTEALPETLKEQINVGDLIYDTESSQLLGKVTDIKSDVYRLTGTNEKTGETASTDISGKVVLIITFEAPVWFEDGSYNVDGYRLSIGREMHVRTTRVAINGECTALTVSEKTA